MEDKLRKLMKQEGINSTKLAEMLGIQASGISHIMSGRNKPSYDFLLKLLTRFPEINPDWLILDKGPMYRDEIKNKAVVRSSSTHPVPVESDNLFSLGASSDSQRTTPSAPAQQLGPDDADIIPARGNANSTVPYAPASQITAERAPSSPIERIVVFYKDKTFTEYHPG